MSRFNELCEEHNHMLDRHAAYCRNACEQAALFRASFSNYVQAPATLFTANNPAVGQPQKRRYVEVNRVDAEWRIVGRNLSSRYRIHFNPEGFLCFKLVVALNSNRGMLQALEIPCGLRPHGAGTCSIFIGAPGETVHKAFDWSPPKDGEKPSEDGPEQYVFHIIKEYLASDPFTRERKSKSIGFI